MCDHEHWIEYTSDISTLCFKHAVEEANNGMFIDVSINTHEPKDCDRCTMEIINRDKLSKGETK